MYFCVQSLCWSTEEHQIGCVSVFGSSPCGMYAHLFICVWFFGNPMDYSSSGSSVHRICQARILEWVAISSSRGSFRPKDWNCFCISYTGRQIHYQLSHWGSPLPRSSKLFKVFVESLCRNVVQPFPLLRNPVHLRLGPASISGSDFPAGSPAGALQPEGIHWLTVI